MFTLSQVIVLGCVCMGMALVTSDKNNSTNSEKKSNYGGGLFASEPKDAPKDYSEKSVREKLSRAYYTDYEVYKIAQALRTDSSFRYDVERDMRRGDYFYEAIESNKEKYLK